MKNKWLMCLMLGLFVLALGPNSVLGGGKSVDINVTGEGISKEDATKDALRNAVERGAGVEIFSESKTTDFVLVRDEILSRAKGYISKYEVVGKPVEDEDGLWSVTINATVKVGDVASDWGEVALLIKQKGHPKVLVNIIDKRLDRERGRFVERTMSSEQANAIVIDYFLSKGMRMVDKDQVQAVHAKDIKAATLKNDISSLIAIAQKYKAQLVVAGVATASFESVKTLYGTRIVRYSAECSMKVYRTDDAQLLFAKAWSLSGPEIPGKGSHDVAAKESIKKIARKLAPKAFEGITRKWIKDLFTGNELTLMVSGCGFRARRKLKRALKAMKDVSAVSISSTSGKNAEFTVVTTMNTESLLDKLFDAEAISEDAADSAVITGNKLKIDMGAGK